MYNVLITDDEGREMRMAGPNVLAIAGGYCESTGVIDAGTETLAQWIMESPRMLEAAWRALEQEK